MRVMHGCTLPLLGMVVLPPSLASNPSNPAPPGCMHQLMRLLLRVLLAAG